MSTRRRTLALLLSVLLVLCATSVALSFDVRANLDSGPYETAEELREALSLYEASATAEQAEMLARSLREMRASEQNKLADSVIRRLGNLYNRLVAGETVSVSSGFSGSRRMPDDSDSWGAAAAAGGRVSLSIDQEQTSGNRTALQFYISQWGASSDSILQAPVLLRVALPETIRTADYTLYGEAGRVSVSFERDASIGRRYIVFRTSRLGRFRLVENEPDRPSRPGYGSGISLFWERVIDRIADAGWGDRIRVNAGTRTTMPADVLREMKYTGTSLAIERSGKSTILIYASEIGRIPDSRSYYTLSSLAAAYRTVGKPASAVGGQLVSSSQEFEYPEFEYPEFEYPSAARQTPASSQPLPTSVPSLSSSSSAAAVLPEIQPEEPSSSEVELESSSDSEPEPTSLPAAAEPVEPSRQELITPLTFALLLIAVMSTSGLIAAVATFLLWKHRRRI